MRDDTRGDSVRYVAIGDSFTETTMNGIGFGLGMAVVLDPTEAEV